MLFLESQHEVLMVLLTLGLQSLTIVRKVRFQFLLE